MFGERYFALRERLCGVISGIHALALDTHTDITGQLPDDAGSDLYQPFVLVACGETNSGKSTLFNGLAGQEICKANVLPETRVVGIYQHGATRRDIERDPLLVEKQIPIDFLRDFHLIDTPGTNSKIEGHEEVTLPLLPSADLIFVVFPISNPWGAATWNFVSRIPAEAFEKVVYIIQQCDQRGPKDIHVTLGHMKDLSLKRTGMVPRMFAVSAKSALDSKQLEEGLALFKASGIEPLENFISEEICYSRQRRERLDTWRYRSSLALREIEDRIEEQTRILNDQGHFIDSIEQEIEGIREQFVIRLPQHLSGVAEVFQIAAVGVSKVLSRRLGALRSIVRLFTNGKASQDMETLFAKRLEESVRSVAEDDGTEVLRACCVHWEDLRERVRETMHVELGDSAELEETLSAPRKHFVNRLQTAARSGIGSLKVRTQLEKDLRRREVALKSFTFTTLLFLTIAGTLGACGLQIIAVIISCIAGIFLTLGIVAAWLTRKSIRADFQDRLLDTCDAFASTLRADYEEALRLVFQEYTECLDGVRKHLIAEKQAVEPRLTRWKELFLTLKAIEQDI